jgi:hypothetical protein
MAAPIRQMMREDVMARGYIDNPDTEPQAFGDDPRLYLIRPTTLAPSPRLDNLAPAHKPIATIRHAIPLRLISEGFSKAHSASGIP